MLNSTNRGESTYRRSMVIMSKTDEVALLLGICRWVSVYRVVFVSRDTNTINKGRGVPGEGRGVVNGWVDPSKDVPTISFYIPIASSPRVI
jgi:hypothetical protein